MNLLSTRHLGGGTVTPGSTMSGSRYVSHATHAARTECWMELAVFSNFPEVPSLAGTCVQERQDLLASTKGAGTPESTSLILQMELFDDECPQLCANFRRLCSGQSSTRQGQVYCYQGLTPSYCGTFFHKIIPGFCAQGGDITMRVKPGGTNSYSSAGRAWLPDEFKKRRHNEIGLVSMANNGPNSNGAQFFITTSATQERAFNGRHCCIGRVVGGLDDFMALVAPFGNVEGFPSKYAVVVDCGTGVAPFMSPSASFAGASQVSASATVQVTPAHTVAAPPTPPLPQPPRQQQQQQPESPARTPSASSQQAADHITAAPAPPSPPAAARVSLTSTTAATSVAAAAAATAAASLITRSPSHTLKSSMKKHSAAAADGAADSHAKHVSYQL